MSHVQPSLAQLGGTSRRLAGRVLAIFENRLELLTLEVQEERDRLICALLLALGLATFGLLAGMALSAGWPRRARRCSAPARCCAGCSADRKRLPGCTL
jgi:uncharacterized membrane protein YqjE